MSTGSAAETALAEVAAEHGRHALTTRRLRELLAVPPVPIEAARSLFAALDATFEPHLAQEERSIFPVVAAVLGDDACDALERDHVALLALLTTLRLAFASHAELDAAPLASARAFVERLEDHTRREQALFRRAGLAP